LVVSKYLAIHRQPPKVSVESDLTCEGNPTSLICHHSLKLGPKVPRRNEARAGKVQQKQRRKIMPNSQNGNQSGGNTSKRGFASIDDEKQRDIASKGGQASGGNLANDPERASEAGKKGGQSSGGGTNR
jgi:general stress protein YciG